jgi:hypothetical protein
MSGATFPLAELRTLLGTRPPTAGIVVTVDGSRLEVATVEGLREARAGDTPPAVWDRVTLRDGIAYPRARPGRRYVV